MVIAFMQHQIVQEGILAPHSGLFECRIHREIDLSIGPDDYLQRPIKGDVAAPNNTIISQTETADVILPRELLR